MSRFHRWFGIALAIVFLATGQYMNLVAHVSELAIGPRILYRSRHIYVLLAALLHLMLGAYLTSAPRGRARVLQQLGSALITIGSGLLVVAFFADAPRADLVPLDLVFSPWGIYSVASGTVLHAIGAATQRRITAPAPTQHGVEHLGQQRSGVAG
jgi:hypothetical protein